MNILLTPMEQTDEYEKALAAYRQLPSFGRPTVQAWVWDWLCRAQARKMSQWLLSHAMGSTPTGWILDDEAEAALKAAGEGK